MTGRELPPGDWRIRVYGRGPSSGAETRRRIRAGERARIIAEQGNCCLYCEIPIGTVIRRKGNDVTLRAQWDHFIPYAYLARNPSTNWVLACHVCNKIKSCRMFQTVQDARAAILPERLRKGCESPRESLLRAMNRSAESQVIRRLAKSPLGPRQAQVLEQVAHGKSNYQIARDARIRFSEVRTFLQGAVRAMGVATCHEAAELAIQRGYIAAPPKPSTETTKQSATPLSKPQAGVSAELFWAQPGEVYRSCRKRDADLRIRIVAVGELSAQAVDASSDRFLSQPIPLRHFHPTAISQNGKPRRTGYALEAP